MSNPKRLGWEDRHPTQDHPIYVRFKGVRRTGKDDGVTVSGATAGFTKSDTLAIEKGSLTLYDNYFGKEGNRCGLTNPFSLYINDKGFWAVSELAGDDVDPVLQSVQDAEAAKPYNPNGGDNVSKGKSMTQEQLVAAIAWSVSRAQEIARDTTNDLSASDAFDKILGCAMFIDWPTTPVTDEEIPF